MSNAGQILEAAEGCVRANQQPEDWTILFGPGGQIEMVAGSGWALDALQRERGSEMAFRVGHRGGRVAVEGRAGSRRCRVESETPAAVARRLLGAPACCNFSRLALTSPKA